MSMSLTSHLERQFDLEDLLDTPNDGHRYEILDNALVVSPSPAPRHQRMVR
ncbi:MAG: hypothetical protein ACRDZQ_04670 [Acidimicrobiales bacterium]